MPRMIEDNELIEIMAAAIARIMARHSVDPSHIVPNDDDYDAARAALTAYRNHQVEL